MLSCFPTTVIMYVTLLFLCGALCRQPGAACWVWTPCLIQDLSHNQFLQSLSGGTTNVIQAKVDLLHIQIEKNK